MLNIFNRQNFLPPAPALAAVGPSMVSHASIHAEIEKTLKERSVIERKQLVPHYFSCLLGTAPSPKMSTIEMWVHKIFLSIECSDKSSLVKVLLGDKKPLEGERAALKELIGNLGVNNTLLLLVRASQLVNRLSEDGQDRSQKAQEKLQGNKVFVHSLLNELLKSPSQMRSVPANWMTSMKFDQEKILHSFVKQLDEVALAKTKSKQMIVAGVALAAVSIVAGLVYSCLKSSSQSVIWPSTCSVTADIARQPLYQKASKINLYELSRMSSARQQETIDEFGLQDAVNCLGGKVDFSNKLKNLSRENLQFTNLASLKSSACSKSSSDLKYALMSDDQIRSLTASELTGISSNEKNVILARIREIQQSSVLVADPKSIDWNHNNIEGISLFDFVNLSSKQLNEVIYMIPDVLLYFSTDDQIKELRFLSLDAGIIKTQRQFQELFQMDEAELLKYLLFDESEPLCSMKDIMSYSDIDRSQRLDRQARLEWSRDFVDPRDLQSRLTSRNLQQSRLRLITPQKFQEICYQFVHSQTRKLNFESLTKENLDRLISSDLMAEELIPEIPGSQLNFILTKLDPSYLRHISYKQLHALDLKILGKNALEILFSKDKQLKLGVLSKNQLDFVVEQLDILNVEPSVFPYSQLCYLDLRSMTADRIENLIFKDNPNWLRYFNEDQISIIKEKLGCFNFMSKAVLLDLSRSKSTELDRITEWDDILLKERWSLGQMDSIFGSDYEKKMEYFTVIYDPVKVPRSQYEKAMKLFPSIDHALLFFRHHNKKIEI